MTPTQIQSRITRCIDIKRRIVEFEDELKRHKAALVAEAESRPDEHAPTDGGGWSWHYADVEGSEVCVTQPARRMKSRLDPEAKGFDNLREVSGRAFTALFLQIPSYKPVDDFQARAQVMLPHTEARKLIRLVTTETSTTVSFEVATAKEATCSLAR